MRSRRRSSIRCARRCSRICPSMFHDATPRTSRPTASISKADTRGTSARRRASRRRSATSSRPSRRIPPMRPPTPGWPIPTRSTSTIARSRSTRRTGVPRSTRGRRWSSTKPFPRLMRRSRGVSSFTIGIGRGPIGNSAVRSSSTPAMPARTSGTPSCWRHVVSTMPPCSKDTRPLSSIPRPSPPGEGSGGSRSTRGVSIWRSITWRAPSR